MITRMRQTPQPPLPRRGRVIGDGADEGLPRESGPDGAQRRLVGLHRRKEGGRAIRGQERVLPENVQDAVRRDNGRHAEGPCLRTAFLPPGIREEPPQVQRDDHKALQNGAQLRGDRGGHEGETGCSVSAKTCQAVVRPVYSAAIEFNSRPIPDCPIVYMDGTWLPLRREGAAGGNPEYEGECIMVAVGIDASGRKNVLDCWIRPTEGASKWEEILASLKSGGLRAPRLFVADGLSGMPEAISNVFPGAKHQRCWIHIVRNMTSDARKKDRDEISDDTKKIYGSKDRASAEAELRSFVSKWARRCPSFAKHLTMPGLFEFMSFPSKARPSLYASNVIEGFNSLLKRKLRSRAAMNSLGNAYYLIMNASERYNASKHIRRIAGFDEMTAKELASLGTRR